MNVLQRLGVSLALRVAVRQKTKNTLVFTTLMRSLDSLVRHCRGLATGEDPSHDRRERGHRQKDEQEIRYGNVPECGDPPVQRIASQPTDHADVTAHHAEECTEKSERARRHGSQRAP